MVNYRYFIFIFLIGITAQLMGQSNSYNLIGDMFIDSKSSLKPEINDTIAKNPELFQEYIYRNNSDSMTVYNKLRSNIIGKAQEYLGVPYRYGKSSEDGFDCSGFVMYVYEKFGFSLPHSSIDQYNMSKHLKKTEVQPGDLVFFMTRKRSISHVGIYLGDNQFIHSPSRGKHVSIESLSSEYYQRHFIGFGSVLKLPVYKRYSVPATIITNYLKEKINFSLPSLIYDELVKCFNRQIDITKQL